MTGNWWDVRGLRPSARLSNADANPLIRFLQPQVIVAARQVGDAQQAAVKRQGLEAVNDIGLGPKLQQGDRVPRELSLGVAPIGHLQRLTLQTVQCLVMGMPVTLQPPGLGDILRTRGGHRHDIGQCPQADAALRIRLQRHLHRLPEIAMLQRESHRPVRFPLTCLAKQVHHILLARRNRAGYLQLQQVQSFDLLRLVNLVHRERFLHCQIQLLVLAQVLNLGLQFEPDLRQPLRHLEFKGRLPVLE